MIASASVLVRLLPIISHAIKRFLGIMRPMTITRCILLDRVVCDPTAIRACGVVLVSLLRYAWPSHPLVGRRPCRHIHSRPSSSSSPCSPCSPSQGTAEPLHAAVRVTNCAQRRGTYAHIHSSTAYAHIHSSAAAAQPVAFLLAAHRRPARAPSFGTLTLHVVAGRPLTLEGVTSLHGWRRKPGT